MLGNHAGDGSKGNAPEDVNGTAALSHVTLGRNGITAAIASKASTQISNSVLADGISCTGPQPQLSGTGSSRPPPT